MRGQNGPGDQAIAALARRQHGVVAYRQLIEAGFNRGAIQYRLDNGRLHHVHRAVYAVGHPVLGRNGRIMSAVLACGPGALLSHRSAGAEWELLPTARAAIDVTAPRSRRSRGDVIAHRVRRLDPQDRAVRDGIPITTVARTLLDVAEVVRSHEFERAVEQAERLRLFDLREVENVCERSCGRRGLRPLRALLGDAVGEPPWTRSELERRFLDLCRDAGLPEPALNVSVAGFVVDFLWSSQRLVIELDGHAFHSTRTAFERDRVRDAKLQLAGFRVMRVTYRRLDRESCAVAQEVGALLSAGPGD
jgi:hypothetical protein